MWMADVDVDVQPEHQAARPLGVWAYVYLVPGPSKIIEDSQWLSRLAMGSLLGPQSHSAGGRAGIGGRK
jgi:hypothetical protein